MKAVGLVEEREREVPNAAGVDPRQTRALAEARNGLAAYVPLRVAPSPRRRGRLEDERIAERAVRHEERFHFEHAQQLLEENRSRGHDVPPVGLEPGDVELLPRGRLPEQARDPRQVLAVERP